MDHKTVQSAFVKLGIFFNDYLTNNYQSNMQLATEDFQEFNLKCEQAHQENPWFTKENIRYSLQQWAYILNEVNLKKWLKPYASKLNKNTPKTIGVVLAGNLPIVGFHDFLSVLISGNNFLGKLSSSDKILLPAIAKVLHKIESKFKQKISFTEGKLENFDAIVATGSNNSARYFEYYFDKYPHIIRKNRNGIAVLTGNEQNLELLAEDIFRYFGLGCRNVSKLYVPEGFDFEPLLVSFGKFEWIKNHYKYQNNYDYNKSIFLVNGIQHYDNGFVLLREEASIPSPISVLHYEFYKNIEELNIKLKGLEHQLQCIISEDAKVENHLLPGQSQKPDLGDYADGIDTLDFLLTIPSKK